MDGAYGTTYRGSVGGRREIGLIVLERRRNSMMYSQVLKVSGSGLGILWKKKKLLVESTKEPTYRR
jgi:hypothetical protein